MIVVTVPPRPSCCQRSIELADTSHVREPTTTSFNRSTQWVGYFGPVAFDGS